MRTRSKRWNEHKMNFALIIYAEGVRGRIKPRGMVQMARTVGCSYTTFNDAVHANRKPVRRPGRPIGGRL